jgi:ABC-type transporter MlaC component
MKQSNHQRIKKVMNFYYNRGQNREFVNEVYRKILSQKYSKFVTNYHNQIEKETHQNNLNL